MDKGFIKIIVGGWRVASGGKLNKPHPPSYNTMENTFLYKPGDVLHLKKRLFDGNPKGANYLIIGHDSFRYVALSLSPQGMQVYSLFAEIFEKHAEKIGEVNLNQIPAGLEALVEFALEDDYEKWKMPPDLSYLKECDALKQYVL